MSFGSYGAPFMTQTGTWLGAKHIKLKKTNIVLAFRSLYCPEA